MVIMRSHKDLGDLDVFFQYVTLANYPKLTKTWQAVISLGSGNFLIIMSAHKQIGCFLRLCTSRFPWPWKSSLDRMESSDFWLAKRIFRNIMLAAAARNVSAGGIPERLPNFSQHKLLPKSINWQWWPSGWYRSTRGGSCQIIRSVATLEPSGNLSLATQFVSEAGPSIGAFRQLQRLQRSTEVSVSNIEPHQH